MTKKRHYYTAQINGGNCNFEILVNGIPVYTHGPDKGSITMNYPLNYLLPASGEQTITIITAPRIDSGSPKLSKFATLTVEVRLFEDVDDPVSEFISILKYELNVPDEGRMPEIYENKFSAELPYEIDLWQNGQNLKEIADIEEKVIAFYKDFWEAVQKKDLARIKSITEFKEESIATMFYFNEQRKLERANSFEELITDVNFQLLPIQESKINFYAKNKLIKMESLDRTPAIKGNYKSEDFGDELITLDLSVYLPSRDTQLKAL